MSISDLIDFLLDLMTDEETQREFAGDPEGTLAGKGLSDVSAQDVRDARLVMADDGTARPRHDGGYGGGGGNDPIREIRHTTNTFEIDQSRTDINQTVLDVDIDDRDTTIVDSFNGDEETNVVAIQDNDVTNNDLDVINIEDSFNDDGSIGEPTEESTVDEPETLPVEEPEASVQPVEEPVLVEEPVDEVVVVDPVEDVEDEAAFDTEPALG